MVTNHRAVVIYYLQVISVYNALAKGWNVSKIGHNKYRFTKPLTWANSQKSTQRFVDELFQLKIIY